MNFDSIHPGDIVGIGIHTGNALRGMEVGRAARERGASVVYGGIHATLYPDEARDLGGAHVVVKGDGDVIWSKVISDLIKGTAEAVYDGGRISGDQFVPARWDLAPRASYRGMARRHGSPTAGSTGARLRRAPRNKRPDS